MRQSNITAYGLSFLLTMIPMIGLADEAKTLAAEKAAVNWLALVDTNRYDASWNEAATLFKRQVSSDDWRRAVSAARDPLGRVIERNLVSSTYATSLPGAPDGEYVVLQFKTKFERKTQAIETVTPMIDAGQWRVSGYYVR